MASVGDGINKDGRWTFDGDVASNFDQHASRSIPLYRQGHDLILQISDSFLSEGSLVYDLGCANGALLNRLADRHQDLNLRCIGIESQKEMIDYALSANRPGNVEYVCHDIVQYDFEPESADLIICYYTVQFVRPAVRQHLINRLFQSLRWGGALLLFEKTRGPDARFQDLLTGLYNDYKLENGYLPAEILQKSQSLRGVLEPFSTQGNFDLLARAGFKDCMTILKYICFEGIIAIK